MPNTVTLYPPLWCTSGDYVSTAASTVRTLSSSGSAASTVRSVRLSGGEPPPHPFDVVPAHLVPARDVAAAALQPAPMQVLVAADTLDHEQPGVEARRGRRPPRGHPVVDDAVHDGGLTEHQLTGQQCFEQAVVDRKTHRPLDAVEHPVRC